MRTTLLPEGEVRANIRRLLRVALRRKVSFARVKLKLEGAIQDDGDGARQSRQERIICFGAVKRGVVALADSGVG